MERVNGEKPFQHLMVTYTKICKKSIHAEQKDAKQREFSLFFIQIFFLSYQLSIHPLSCASQGPGRQGSSLMPRPPSPQALPPALPGGPEGQQRDIVPPACPSSHWDMPWTPPRGGIQGASENKCRSHLSWFLSMWRSSGCSVHKKVLKWLLDHTAPSAGNWLINYTKLH